MQTSIPMNPSTQRPRRIELQAMGLVSDTGRTRETRAGRNAVVWGAFMKKEYRLCVCGSRHFDDYDLLCRKLDKLTEKIKEKRKIVIVTGAGAGIVIGNRKRQGADALAEKWAYERRYSLLRFHADWNKHGKAAGPIRNSEMIEEGQPDAVIAFWDGESKGTKDTIDKAEAAGITTRIVRIEK